MMNNVVIIGIIFGVAVAAVSIFASIPNDTWQDKRTEFTGVAPSDENNEMVNCLSKGGTWDGTSCNDESFEGTFEESFDESMEKFAISINSEEPVEIPESVISTVKCSPKNAQCVVGVVTGIIDGDTIKVDGQSIRFALASAPEINEDGGQIAREFIATLCPVGYTVLVDEDDGQIEGSYGRIVGVVHCHGMNLNEELLDSGIGYLSSEFCDVSEFASHAWAQKHGC